MAAESSLTMEDHQHLEECSTHVEAKSTEAGSRDYVIGEDFHDGEKDLLSSEVFLQPNANEMPPAKQDDGKEAESSLTMEDHQHLEECSTHVEAKSTATDGDTGSRGSGIREDFHDGEKDLLSSEVFLQPNANDMPPAKQDDGKRRWLWVIILATDYRHGRRVNAEIFPFSVFVLCVPSSILRSLNRLFHSKVEALHHNRLSVFRGASDLNTFLRVTLSTIEEVHHGLDCPGQEGCCRGHVLAEEDRLRLSWSGSGLGLWCLCGV
ncbi:unnamed protein product [Cyprideis torosa]|uniref:Uncharacterized protein n=1 Tax=Cyprideis torosa TaxID=163714 RepID=A0A7R8ZUW4_9CRUS|nr:unnamed protein product [Cyprideis torosa]CAG0901663.1 unnamed protein product [Cyprideis torosa]